MDEEIWKEIKGYEGRYLVSNLGRVRGYPRWVEQPHGGKRYIDGHILAQRLSGNGYMSIRLIGADGKNKTFSTHRLVAMNFIDNPNNLPCVNHKDENKLNNAASNLEWCTYKENINYGTCIKRRDEKRQYRVEMIDSTTLKVLKTFESIKIASEETGISERQIAVVCAKSKNVYRAGGYLWRYADESVRQKKCVNAELRTLPRYYNRGCPVEKLDKNTNEVLEVFSNMTEACKAMNVSSSTIVSAMKRGSLSCGYKWRYAAVTNGIVNSDTKRK